ncbi:fumarylacetoacetate hydrolase family protein [Novosphingobium sp. PASSN1]|uniref:fumarylacetoacetate hydrolase family protein n=1 Tax=Novosphingobium sp. PASSN1 TaxID=2015561 RepID=UPI000BD1714A|nr:fumarylacetoacetate hydrolase family protein [Novosphingobium sp. PASSN1]OYU34324.1 MAG: 5-carboxymethyl-2-hydroxymuconate isomerase [Novosphingobium sp. PASSN1]
MKIASFDAGDGPETGVVIGDRIHSTGIAGSMIDLIEQWAQIKEAVAANSLRDPGLALDEIRLLAPVERPGKIFAIGLNYADHIAESAMGTPEQQVWFTKAVTSINGPYAPVLIATGAPKVDYEVELVAIIGKRGKYISRQDAPAHVFGYCVGNDVTERAWQHATSQWSLGKSFDTHGPIGPWITTADEVGDPHTLDLRCVVNGEVRQSSNTRNLVFNLWEQIEHLSHAMTLEAGDLIFSGTPGGVGAAMKPPRFLKQGDVVRCEIERLGAIEAVLKDEDQR